MTQLPRRTFIGSATGMLLMNPLVHAAVLEPLGMQDSAWGTGPSSMDSFDYKPALQQHHGKPLLASIRDSLQGTKFVDVLHGTKDELMASPFGWKQYGQNGMWISDLFPNTAGHVDKLCFLHSVQAIWNELNLLFKQLYSRNRRTVNQQLANNCSSALVGLSCVACCSISTNSPTSTDNNNRRMDRLVWLCF